MNFVQKKGTAMIKKITKKSTVLFFPKGGQVKVVVPRAGPSTSFCCFFASMFQGADMFISTFLASLKTFLVMFKLTMKKHVVSQKPGFYSQICQ